MTTLRLLWTTLYLETEVSPESIQHVFFRSPAHNGFNNLPHRFLVANQGIYKVPLSWTKRLAWYCIHCARKTARFFDLFSFELQINSRLIS